MDTVETLCDAIVKAEDAVMHTDASGNATFQVASTLNEDERKHTFSKVRDWQYSVGIIIFTSSKGIFPFLWPAGWSGKHNWRLCDARRNGD